MDNFPFTLFLIFSGAAILATVALYLRQTIIVAYIIAGMIAGPSVSGLIENPAVLEQAGSVGVTFLLFLLGMNLPPSKLASLLGPSLTITGISSFILMLIGLAFGLLIGLNLTESIILGTTLMFSSTIIALKLLPTTVLHHRRTGEIIISVLLLQDAIAIFVLFAIQIAAQLSEQTGAAGDWLRTGLLDLGTIVMSLPLIVLIAYTLQRLVINRLMMAFDRIKEYLFLIAIGWCVGISELATVLGLSHEIGAFIAGVTIATQPIALFIAESLKPVRDFFLIIFFFALGGQIDVHAAQTVLHYGILLAVIVLVLKPLLFDYLMRWVCPEEERSREIGVRLGQGSEFSLLVAALAWHNGLISDTTSYLVQIMVIASFVGSSFWIVRRYPTPIALSDELRRD